ncbi:MAG: hypothetical protein AAFV32_10640 [Myxococcota bacterium]
MAQLQRLDVAVPDSLWTGERRSESYIVELTDDDPRLQQVLRFAESLEYTTIIHGKKFTEQDLRDSPWLAMRSAKGEGQYPKPEATYRDEIYDFSSGCRRCGIGKKQVASFKMHKLRWGRSNIMTPGWQPTDFIAKAHLYENVFKDFDVPYREVLWSRNSKPMPEARQLRIESTASVDASGLTTEFCQHCGRTKYNVPIFDYFPRLTEEPDRPVIRMNQWLGSGGGANQWVLVANEVYRELSSYGVRGADFVPVLERKSQQPFVTTRRYIRYRRKSATRSWKRRVFDFFVRR